MPILMMDYSALATTDLYVDFISTLVWYRMYCVGRFGKSKKDYVNGFKQLKESYDALWQFFDTKFPEWHEKPVIELFQSIESILTKSSLTDNQIKRISDLLYEFENETEREFRNKFNDHLVEDSSKYQYGVELFNIIGDLMNNEKYEEAVFNAFKYLDNQLQRLLDVSPHRYYGEDLINFAFASNTGKLQLDTTTSEQMGLRKFVSGANALFRNPSAHRFAKYNDFEASTVIGLITLITKLSTNLAKRQKEN